MCSAAQSQNVLRNLWGTAGTCIRRRTAVSVMSDSSSPRGAGKTSSVAAIPRGALGRASTTAHNGYRWSSYRTVRVHPSCRRGIVVATLQAHTPTNIEVRLEAEEEMSPKFALATFAIALASQSATASPIVISTMPSGSDVTSIEATFASFAWFDLASGFEVTGPGKVTNITAALTTSGRSSGGFTVGLASNDMIGNPALPSYFSPPPGSLWETRVCSPALRPGLSLTACGEDANSYPSANRLELLPGDNLDLAVDILLPTSGVYWLYTRFDIDDVFATWTKNESIQSDRVARRSGICTGPSAGCANATTFSRVNSAQATPGLRIVFEPDRSIPEPSSAAIVALGIFLLALGRRSADRALAS